MSRTLILIRHGRPHLPKRPGSLSEYLAAYDQATIDPGLPPPISLINRSQNIDTWFCSPLPRAQSSLARLSTQVQPLVSDLFREASLPAVERPRFIPLLIWLAYLRGRWLQGQLSAQESLEECRTRACSAADFLLSHLSKDREAALMGHGYFNFLISETLCERGWKQDSTGRGYWSVRILTEA